MDLCCLLLYISFFFDAVAHIVWFSSVSLFGLVHILLFSDSIQATEEERENQCW